MSDLRIFEYFVQGIPHTAQMDKAMANKLGLDWDKPLGAQADVRPVPADGDPTAAPKEKSTKAKVPTHKAVIPENK